MIASEKNMIKTCRNCDKSFTDYGEFKRHIKECNDRITIGDQNEGGRN
jgi:hypothetical protein